MTRAHGGARGGHGFRKHTSSKSRRLRRGPRAHSRPPTPAVRNRPLVEGEDEGVGRPRFPARLHPTAQRAARVTSSKARGPMTSPKATSEPQSALLQGAAPALQAAWCRPRPAPRVSRGLRLGRCVRRGHTGPRGHAAPILRPEPERPTIRSNKKLLLRNHPVAGLVREGRVSRRRARRGEAGGN